MANLYGIKASIEGGLVEPEPFIGKIEAVVLKKHRIEIINKKLTQIIMNIKKKVSGFTLIEIMITVAIIGVLSSIAIPSYMNYIKKAKASELVAVYDEFRVNMMDFHTKNGRFPTKDAGDGNSMNARNSAAGLGDRSSYETDTIKYAWITNSGAIKIQLQDDSLSENNDSNRFAAKGEKVGGRFIWYCNIKSETINGWVSKVDDKYLPKRCQDQ